jgi:hypothetical protein
MKSIYTLLPFLIMLTSCGTSNSVTSNHFFQKRKYTSGWKLNHSTKVVSANEEFIKENKTTDASLYSTINLEESTSNLIELGSSIQAECDTIILNDGKIVRATILSTTDSTISYNKCESDEPAEFTINKKEIKAIQYANGKFEFIKHESAEDVHRNEWKKKELTKEKIKEENIEKNKERSKTAIIVIFSIFGAAALAIGLLFIGMTLGCC